MTVKKIVQLVFLFGLAVGMTESIARLFVYYGLGIEETGYSRYYREDSYFRLLTWVEKYKVHPYFGYENAGIREFERSQNGAKGQDFVIGVLGGSVAEQIADYLSNDSLLLLQLNKAIPESSGRPIRVVNLAMGGAKQPQQFFIAAYFLDSLDLLINIDGFNEVQRVSFFPVYPLDFPTLSLRLYDRTSEGRALAGLGHFSIWIYKTLNRLPLELPLLSHSSLYFAGWQVARDRLYRLTQEIQERYYAVAIKSRREADAANQSPQILDERVRTWKRYTILQSDIALRGGKPMFFFLQPNQYLKNSKPFSEEEQQNAFNAGWDKINHEGMTRLKGELAQLRQAGVRIYDLTGIFKDTKETVYRDACCHLNSLGNKMAAEEIVRTISRSLSAGQRRVSR